MSLTTPSPSRCSCEEFSFRAGSTRSRYCIDPMPGADGELDISSRGAHPSPAGFAMARGLPAARTKAGTLDKLMETRLGAQSEPGPRLYHEQFRSSVREGRAASGWEQQGGCATSHHPTSLHPRRGCPSPYFSTSSRHCFCGAKQAIAQTLISMPL